MGYFNPAGALATGGWTIQSDGETTTQQRAQGLGATGDEVASKLYDKRGGITETYKLFEGAGTLPVVGSVVGGYHIDSIQVGLSDSDWPTLTVTGHKHPEGEGHTGMREYTPTVSIVAAWGVPAAPFGITVGTLTTVGVRSAEYSLAVTHLDELGGDGKQIGAQNRDGVETLSISYVGDVEPTGPEGWDRLELGRTRDNQAAESRSAAWEKHISADGDAGAE